MEKKIRDSEGKSRIESLAEEKRIRSDRLKERGWEGETLTEGRRLGVWFGKGRKGSARESVRKEGLGKEGNWELRDLPPRLRWVADIQVGHPWVGDILVVSGVIPNYCIVDRTLLVLGCATISNCFLLEEVRSKKTGRISEIAPK